MRKFSLFFVLIFILSTLLATPIGVSADVSSTPMQIFYNYDGSTTQNSEGNANLIVNQASNNSFAVARMPANNPKPQADGTLNFTAEQGVYLKDASDKVLHHTYIGNANTSVGWGTPAHRINKTVPTATYKYQVWEFDVLFANEASSISIAFTDNSAAKYYANILASSSAAEVTGLGAATYSTAGVKKWHTVRVSAPIDGTTSEPIKIYVDNFTTPAAQSSAVTLAGLTMNYQSGMFFFAANGKISDVYVDNLKIFLGDSDTTLSAKASATLTDAELGTLSGETITLNKKTTAAELKAALNVTGGTLLGIYDANMNEISGTISEGSVAVLKNTDNSLFTYYDIATYSAPQVYTNAASYSGSETVTPKGVESVLAAVALTSNSPAPHKDSTNTAYKLEDTTGTVAYNSPGYFYLTPSISKAVYGANATTSDATKKHTKIALEFNIMPVSGDFTYGLRFKNGPSANDWSGFLLNAGKGGSFSLEGAIIATIETGKWSHVVYEFPNDGVGTTATLYVNGTKIGDATIPAATGFAQENYNPLGCVYANKSTYEFYLDDIKVGYTDLENKGYADCPREDAEIEAASNGVLYTATTITAPAGMTADELIESLSIYNASSAGVYRGTATVDGKVKTGDLVALISNDGGVASYYTVEVEGDVVDAGIYIDGNDVTVVTDDTVLNAATSGKILIAVYDNSGKLAAIDSADFAYTSDDIETTFEGILANTGDYETIKAIYINAFESLMPYCTAVVYTK